LVIIYNQTLTCGLESYYVQKCFMVERLHNHARTKIWLIQLSK